MEEGLSSLETMQSSITSTQTLKRTLEQLSKYSNEGLCMYESITNGECIQKPQFDYQEFVRTQNEKPIFAQSDIFTTANQVDDGEEESKDYEADTDEEAPQRFNSARHKRLYRGRDSTKFTFTPTQNQQSSETTRIEQAQAAVDNSTQGRIVRRRSKPKKPIIMDFVSKVNSLLRTTSNTNSETP